MEQKQRLMVLKTYKLFINGQFPRTESGRSIKIDGLNGQALAHVCRASRKDLRNAVEAASAAQSGWAGRSAYNRGQILYRMAEMLEARAGEFTDVIASTVDDGCEAAAREVQAAIDRLVSYAGWTDKFSQMLGTHNPVAGPHYNFTVPEAIGVVGVVAPDALPLLGLVSLIAPALCAGNTVVALGSEAHPLATAIVGEVCATSDVPAGVVNLLTGLRSELVEHFAGHREIGAIHAANLPGEQAERLRAGSAENLKRVVVRAIAEPEGWYDESACHSPWWIEPLIDFKTIWHPSGI
ncbi:MAG: aldehyde dehydrogenase family protein [Planctomycetes bacterium]|nr:aldehyde dehydrogenase family protein [Planctomycetota bacterium]NOG54357.1 aldehyde dehydrogenase family protein [Planctomycetota bacterium]